MVVPGGRASAAHRCLAVLGGKSLDMIRPYPEPGGNDGHQFRSTVRTPEAGRSRSAEIRGAVSESGQLGSTPAIPPAGDGGFAADDADAAGRDGQVQVRTRPDEGTQPSLSGRL